MRKFDIDEILLEANYKSNKGYIDLESVEDIQLLKHVMYDMGYSHNIITEYVDELFYQNMKDKIFRLEQSELNENILDNILKFISKGWQKLKSYITNLFEIAFNELKKDYTFEKEYTINITPELSENINVAANLIKEAKSGAIDAMKGLYNEALVCEYIWEHKDISVVNIDKIKYKEFKNEFSTNINNYKSKIKDTKVISEIETGSRAMANYLINNAKIKGLIIVGVFQSGKKTTITEKKDISIIVRRGLSKEEILNYSLKLYSGKEIGMSNSTSLRTVYNLTAKDGVPPEKSKLTNIYTEKFELILEKKKQTDPKFKKYFNILSDIRKKMNALKNQVSINPELSDKIEIKLNKYRKVVTLLRNYINPIYAEIVFTILKEFSGDDNNKKILVRNLLQLLGFTNMETKILLSIMKENSEGNKVVDAILDEHPDFDLSNINLTKPAKVTIRINNGQELIVKLNFSEGEKQKVKGLVSFKKVKSVDPKFWQDVI